MATLYRGQALCICFTVVWNLAVPWLPTLNVYSGILLIWDWWWRYIDPNKSIYNTCNEWGKINMVYLTCFWYLHFDGMPHTKMIYLSDLFLIQFQVCVSQWRKYCWKGVLKQTIIITMSSGKMYNSHKTLK